MTVDLSKLTRPAIDRADPGQLERWVAAFRGIESGHDPDLGDYWVWGDPPLHPDGDWEEPHVRPCPPPYARSAWASDRLLGDLEGTICEGDFIPDEGPAWGVVGYGDVWQCGPAWQEGIDGFGRGGSRHIAICRAFLIAAIRGLLDVGIQGELELEE